MCENYPGPRGAGVCLLYVVVLIVVVIVVVVVAVRSHCVSVGCGFFWGLWVSDCVKLSCLRGFGGMGTGGIWVLDGLWVRKGRRGEGLSVRWGQMV